LKINLIIPSFYPAIIYGGPIFSSLHTCQELVKLDDIEIYVSTTNTNMTSKLNVEINRWQEFKKNLYVKYYNETIIDKFSLQLYLNIWKDIKLADIVHIQAIFNTPAPISLLYAKLFKRPILLSPRGALCHWCINHGSKFKKLWLLFLIKPFIKNIYWHATCEAEKHDILAIYSKAKIVIIPNGVEVGAYKNISVLNKNEYLKKYIGKDINVSHIIVSMSRLHAKKGFDILIESFEKTLQNYPDAILLIAGPDVGVKPKLVDLIKELNLENKVYFIGSVSGQEKVDFLANADLFVLPSNNENFGNVYVESLAAGTPIVASTGTPWQEVEGADCGKWVDNNVEETTEAICQMLQKDREKMRLNSRKLSQKYDWKNIAKQFEKIFKEMIVNKKKINQKKEGKK
jgi:glycosyltransferase involved in cell wall biosynthesis